MSQIAASSSPPHLKSFDAIYPGTSQVVAIGGSSVQSDATQTGTSVVQLTATVACFIAISDDPTAAADTTCYLPANVPTKFGLVGGNKIAVIQAASSGSLYITEGA